MGWQVQDMILLASQKTFPAIIRVVILFCIQGMYKTIDMIGS